MIRQMIVTTNVARVARGRRSLPGSRLLPTALLALAALALPVSTPAQAARGANFSETDAVPYSDSLARRSLRNLRQLGANTVALIPFAWQASPGDTAVTVGDGVTEEHLLGGIEAAKELGFTVWVKPHVWVPERWAGSVAMSDSAAWSAWFRHYTEAMVHYARLAERGGADVFSVGVELRQSLERPEWRRVIGRVREVFGGRITYVAHGVDDLRRVPFWDRLDFAALTLYPSLGDSPADSALRREVGEHRAELEAAARELGRELWVAELGLRSARGAQARPWESPEERPADPDPLLQARVLDLWLEALRDGPVDGVLVYRWFTDPRLGGREDTDFTVQNKPAEGVLLSHWR